MGYYVDYNGTITIPNDKERKIFHAMQEVENTRCGDADAWEILKWLGFILISEEENETRTVCYSDKSGNEDQFLEALTNAGGSVYLEARGEDGGLWLIKGTDGVFRQLAGTVVYGEIGEDFNGEN